MSVCIVISKVLNTHASLSPAKNDAPFVEQWRIWNVLLGGGDSRAPPKAPRGVESGKGCSLPTAQRGDMGRGYHLKFLPTFLGSDCKERRKA